MKVRGDNLATVYSNLHVHVHVHVNSLEGGKCPLPPKMHTCTYMYTCTCTCILISEVCVCIIEGSSLSPSPAVCSAECADREGPTGREGTELARRHEREGRSCSAALCHTAAAATGTGTHIRTCIHVPDKLCVFPARRELTSSKQLLSRDCWLVWPHHDSFFYDCTNVHRTCVYMCIYMCMYMYMYRRPEMVQLHVHLCTCIYSVCVNMSPV